MTQPTKLNYITCEFGVPGRWAAGYHTGIDYRAAVDTDIFATKGGRVVHAGVGGTYGNAYGSHVVLQSFHKGQPVQVLYAHLTRPTVRKGQWVKTGQVVGKSGETGNTNGPHLHYEERLLPFDYWSHRNPVFPNWIPLNKKFRNAVFRRIGLLKKK